MDGIRTFNYAMVQFRVKPEGTEQDFSLEQMGQLIPRGLNNPEEGINSPPPRTNRALNYIHIAS